MIGYADKNPHEHKWRHVGFRNMCAADGQEALSRGLLPLNYEMVGMYMRILGQARWRVLLKTSVSTIPLSTKDWTTTSETHGALSQHLKRVVSVMIPHEQGFKQ